MTHRTLVPAGLAYTNITNLCHQNRRMSTTVQIFSTDKTSDLVSEVLPCAFYGEFSSKQSTGKRVWVMNII